MDQLQNGHFLLVVGGFWLLNEYLGKDEPSKSCGAMLTLISCVPKAWETF
jgi:hypothetical protein